MKWCGVSNEACRVELCELWDGSRCAFMAIAVELRKIAEGMPDLRSAARALGGRDEPGEAPPVSIRKDITIGEMEPEAGKPVDEFDETHPCPNCVDGKIVTVLAKNLGTGLIFMRDACSNLCGWIRRRPLDENPEGKRLDRCPNCADVVVDWRETPVGTQAERGWLREERCPTCGWHRAFLVPDDQRENPCPHCPRGEMVKGMPIIDAKTEKGNRRDRCNNCGWTRGVTIDPSEKGGSKDEGVDR